ncbi:MAG: sulfite exporter TauE/SafE family protein [Candidatus Aminicenantes bacterium]|nr:sulfite exporter TauE/SafE family protein [Candidatus Aminicenantes bacterium]
MDLLNLILLFVVGVVAGFINVNAGGGSSLTLPTLIFMGMDSAMANGTNRIALLLQNIFAVTSFRKNKFHQFKTSLGLAVFTLPGAIFGAVAATQVSHNLFQKILAVVLLFIVISIFFTSSYKNRLQAATSHWSVYPAMFIIGFYGGFIQVGVGFLLMAALYHLLKVNLVLVNMHKVFIILVYTMPALLIFILTGNVIWKYGLALAAGNSIGGWWGARAAVKGGEKFIRIVLAITIFIMAVKLFLG